MKHTLLSILFMGLVVFASAGNKENKNETSSEKAELVSFSGEVTDQITREALVGVKVSLEGTDQVVYTDFDGKYSFEDVKPGTYHLTASFISYEKTSVEELELSLNTNQVNLSLKSSN
ncbi:carboxypeptidase-like regulatory domain-containing protein [Gaoshiqia sp. Z1-71]|uniref:carboxypeptidase-like regulatory domain-containing protein n=1 Tax=Gaoshiqia hydrogeniformans TaxID=3290090 RepID=UPI003BF85E41